MVSLVLVGAVALLVATISLARAEPGSQPTDTPVSAETRNCSTAEAARPFEVRLWDWLQQSNYKNWAPAPEQTADFYAGESPHGAFLKMYLNRTAVADPKNLPHGSLIVKENFGKDKKLMAVTVMVRSEGFDPEHNDWVWVKYMPNGTVAKTPPAKGSMKLVGKVKGCIMCHGGADGDDFAFFND